MTIFPWRGSRKSNGAFSGNAAFCSTACARREGLAVLVTNEVGLSLVPPYRMGRVFTDILGRVNQRLAAEADEVLFMACGLPLRLK